MDEEDTAMEADIATSRTPLRFQRGKKGDEEDVQINYKKLIKKRMKMHMNVNIV